MASSTPEADGAPGRGSFLPRRRSRLTSRFDCLLSIVILALITSSSPAALPGVAAAADTNSQQALLSYIPTIILIPEANTVPLQQNATPDIAYIFSPRDGDGGPVELLALNISASLSGASSSSAPVSLSSDLPFLTGSSGNGGSSTIAFSPSLADNGTIVVFAGDCSSPVTESSIWTFDPSAGSDGKEGSASWTRQSTAAEDGDADSAATEECGPGFLGSSLSFSTTLEPEMSKATVYVYGGMCPDDAGVGASQSNATYSNQMLRIAPSPDNDKGGYVVAPASSKGPPVAAAGFTLTALPPSIANRSSGSVTQQVNYVLLGGHTRRAFVDMGTVALWSLPEESWGFVSEIEVTSSTTSEFELAVKAKEQRAPNSIDSRSGHTTILNEDGTALVVLGGWVGNLGQAAEPQLAVLHIGADYGGDGDWRWSVPTDSQPPGPGIYGHGAALLPGNVMLVYGGYSISSGGSSTRKRQANNDAGGVPMFLNLTSMTWSDDYTNPLSQDAGGNGNGGGDMTTDGPEDTSEDQKKRLGFGLGLGLGLLAILAGVLGWLFYRRRQRHRRTIRNSALQALAQDTSHFIHDDYNEMAESRHSGAGGGGGVFPWYAGGPDPYGRGTGALGYKSLRSNPGRAGPSWHGGPQQTRGSLMTSALPPRGGPAGRGQYQPTPTGPIHPIEEADEETSLHDGGGGGDLGVEPLSPVREGQGEGEKGNDPSRERDHDRGEHEREATDRDSARYSDPFATPTTQERPVSFPQAAGRASMTPSPERERRDPEVQDWMMDIDAADALLSGRAAAAAAAAAAGPSRPPLSGSAHTPTTPTTKPSLIRRATDRSTRSARSLGAFFGGASGSGGGGIGDDDYRTDSNISESNRSGLTPSRSDSIRSQILLQRAPGFGIAPAVAAAEGRVGTGGSGGSGGAKSEGSGGSGSAASPSYNTARSSFNTLRAEGPSLLLGRQRSNDGGNDDEPLSPPGSPSKSKPQRRSGGWLGSLRRVFSGPSPSPPGSSQDNDSARRSPRRGSFAEAANDIDAARLGGLGSIAAGGLLRRKGGRGAWESDTGGGGESSRAGAEEHGYRYGYGGSDRGGLGDGADDDEWDIEKAIERRLVQVMFTVPKERLRVVNTEPEIDDALSGVLVNPDDEEEEARVDEKRALVSVHSSESDNADAEADGGCRLSTHTVPSLRLENPEEEALRGEDEQEQQQQRGRRRDKVEEGQDLTVMDREMDIADQGRRSDDDGDDGDKNEPRPKKKRVSRLSALEQEIDLLGAELEAQRANQPSRTASDLHSEGDVFSAEAARLERPAAPYHSPQTTPQHQPRTRVLEMVESIESLSRDHSRSPAGSPIRSPSPLKGKGQSPGSASSSPTRPLKTSRSDLGRD